VSIALVLSDARVADVRPTTSALGELMACLHSFAEFEHHPEVRDWLTHVRGTMSPQLASMVSRFQPLWARYRCRLLLPTDPTPGTTLADGLEAVRRMPMELFVGLAANGIRGNSTGVLDPRGDAVAEEEFVRTCEQRSFSRGELARSLLDDPDRLRRDLLGALELCDEEFFAAEWRRVHPALDDAASTLMARLRQQSLVQVIGSLSATATVVHHPPEVRFDKLQSDRVELGNSRPCLLVPSVHTWPHLLVKSDPGLPVVVHFPARPPQSAHTLESMRRCLAVLSDPGRLGLCRHLLGEEITTSELATRTGYTRPQVSRHLSQLRSVGMVRSQRQGRLVYHRLNTLTLARLGPDLLTAIMR